MQWCFTFIIMQGAQMHFKTRCTFKVLVTHIPDVAAENLWLGYQIPFFETTNNNHLTIVFSKTQFQSFYSLNLDKKNNKMKIILAIPNSSNTCPCLNFNVSANIHCIGRQLRLGTYVFKMQKLIHVGQSVGGHTVKIFLHLKYYLPKKVCLSTCVSHPCHRKRSGTREY